MTEDSLSTKDLDDRVRDLAEKHGLPHILRSREQIQTLQLEVEDRRFQYEECIRISLERKSEIDELKNQRVELLDKYYTLVDRYSALVDKYVAALDKIANPPLQIKEP